MAYEAEVVGLIVFEFLLFIAALASALLGHWPLFAALSLVSAMLPIWVIAICGMYCVGKLTESEQG